MEELELLAQSIIMKVEKLTPAPARSCLVLPNADPLNINGGVGTVGTINNNEGRKADPLNINGGVGTIGTINNKEGRKLELLPCPYSVGHPLQFWCNYEPFTWNKFPLGFPFHKYPFHQYPFPAGFPFHKYPFPPGFPFNN